MAQIYSYPIVAPLSTDVLIGSRIDSVNDTQVTYNFTVSSIVGTIADVTAPTSATSNGVAGQIATDANYIYVCTATNTWKRAAIATW
jgi:hypothetical protein